MGNVFQKSCCCPAGGPRLNLSQTLIARLKAQKPKQVSDEPVTTVTIADAAFPAREMEIFVIDDDDLWSIEDVAGFYLSGWGQGKVRNLVITARVELLGTKAQIMSTVTAAKIRKKMGKLATTKAGAAIANAAGAAQKVSSKAATAARASGNKLVAGLKHLKDTSTSNNPFLKSPTASKSMTSAGAGELNGLDDGGSLASTGVESRASLESTSELDTEDIVAELAKLEEKEKVKQVLTVEITVDADFDLRSAEAAVVKVRNIRLPHGGPKAIKWVLRNGKQREKMEEEISKKVSKVAREKAKEALAKTYCCGSKA